MFTVNTTMSECSGPMENNSTLNSTWRRRARSADSEAEGAASPAAARRRTRHAARLNMGASTDDIHVCIMCMRAIMNNKVSDPIYFLRIHYRMKFHLNTN